jgi:hypothetical protein
MAIFEHYSEVGREQHGALGEGTSSCCSGIRLSSNCVFVSALCVDVEVLHERACVR